MHYFSNERLFFKGLFPSVQRLPLLGSTHAVLGRGFFSLNSGQALYPQTPTSARDPGPKASPRFLHGSPGPAARSPGRRKHAAAPASGTRGPGQPGHGCAPGGTPRPWLCLPPAICPWSPSGPTEDEPLEKERHQAKGRDPRDRPLRTGSEAGSGTRGGLSPASSPPCQGGSPGSSTTGWWPRRPRAPASPGRGAAAATLSVGSAFPEARGGKTDRRVSREGPGWCGSVAEHNL